MAVTTFGDLKERVARDLEAHLSRLTGDEIGCAIVDAVERWADAPLWWTDGITTGLTTTASQASDTLPTEFVQIYEVTMTVSNDQYPVDPIPYDEYRWLQADEVDLVGQPFRYSLYNNKIWWYPTPDQAYSYKLYYQKRLTTLSADTDTNDWITYGWQWLRWEALAELGTSPLDLPEQQVGRWRALAERERQRLLSKSTGRMVMSQGLPREF